MTTEVTQYPSSPREDSFDNEGSPSIDTRPPPERETNIMPQGELDHLRQSCSFPAGLHFSIHPMIRRILAYYNICPVQLALNVCQSVIGTVEITRSSPIDYLGSLEFRGSRGRRAPYVSAGNLSLVLTEIEQESFGLDSRRMASNGRDNAKEKSAGDATHIAAVEGESRLSLGDPPEVIIPKLGGLVRSMAALELRSNAPREGTSANPRVALELNAFHLGESCCGLEAPPRAHYARRQGSNRKIGPHLGNHEPMTQLANARSNWDKMILSQNVAKDLESWIAELEAEKQHAAEELKRMKEDHSASLERHEKEMAELREKEAFSKRSVDEDEEKDELDNNPPPQ
ncbi:hypothetical protein Acr_00g0049280 [Actinidia rufa]|uniref:Uncharacterized protein n=1 Tax=Actinidia rufa TaxID=165716 RepID=A0A7J0DKW3_9ERIC|nr:hypothetical protein Acr_00g0049280 [Actinidia rufa]